MLILLGMITTLYLCKHPLMILASTHLYFDGMLIFKLFHLLYLINRPTVVWKKHSFICYQNGPMYFLFYSVVYKSITAFTYFDAQIIPHLFSGSLSTLAPVFFDIHNFLWILYFLSLWHNKMFTLILHLSRLSLGISYSLRSLVPFSGESSLLFSYLFIYRNNLLFPGSGHPLRNLNLN